MRLASAILLVALLAAGCSSADDSVAPDPASAPTTAATTAAPTGPDCRGIWKDGAELPSDFTTCLLDGALPTFEVTDCQDGTRLIIANEVLWARTGGEITRTKDPAEDTDAYLTDLALCTGR